MRVGRPAGIGLAFGNLRMYTCDVEQGAEAVRSRDAI
jgi:hypothetical protein